MIWRAGAGVIGQDALDRARVPTGMKAGVRILAVRGAQDAGAGGAVRGREGEGARAHRPMVSAAGYGQLWRRSPRTHVSVPPSPCT